MGIVAFLCGIFYGWLLHDARQIERKRAQAQAWLREVEPYFGHCAAERADECACGAPAEPILDAQGNVWAMRYCCPTDDRASYWPKGHVEA